MSSPDAGEFGVSPFKIRWVMSRAFTKESVDDLAAGELPERPLPVHPNYVTTHGLEQLQARARELQGFHEKLAVRTDEDSAAKQKLREVERDQRYFKAQLDRAEVVDLVGQPRDEVHFGATVKIRDEDDREQTFTIVGDDEADVAAGKVSWASPLAKAMIGARAGDTVKWRRPVGDAEVEIVEIRYPRKA